MNEDKYANEAFEKSCRLRGDITTIERDIMMLKDPELIRYIAKLESAAGEFQTILAGYRARLRP